MNSDSKAASPAGPPRGVTGRWSSIVALVSKDVDYKAVGEQVTRAGAISGGYLMMTAISAAIAILGLLLSSPAVVIGAMLLSPLMGPIVLLGFSFWTVDWVSTRKALASLGAGFGIALAVSIALTLVSPLKEPTAEILARSRPTLFDLLVAVFSGIAGGYAVVRGLGATVIGVAIATALMPPLAVVGFGIGTDAWPIAGGALLLFFTNLIAIALAAAVVAAVSGFRPRVRLTGGGWVPRLAVVAILGLLCIPLTVSLGTIALESRATALTRSDLVRLFGSKARIASLTITADKHVLQVAGLIATPRYVEHVSEKLAQDLRSKVRGPVVISLDQVVLADPSTLKPIASPPPAAVVAPAFDPAAAAVADLSKAVPFAGATVSYDPASGAGVVQLSAASGLDLAGARALEDGLRARPGEENTLVTPPVQPLPPLSLITPASGVVEISGSSLQQWALARWRAASVDAELCRGGHRGVHAKDVTKALEQGFSPLAVQLASDPAACAGTVARPPFVVVRPGTATAATPLVARTR